MKYNNKYDEDIYFFKIKKLKKPSDDFTVKEKKVKNKNNKKRDNHFDYYVED